MWRITKSTDRIQNADRRVVNQVVENMCSDLARPTLVEYTVVSVKDFIVANRRKRHVIAVNASGVNRIGKPIDAHLMKAVMGNLTLATPVQLDGTNVVFGVEAVAAIDIVDFTVVYGDSPGSIHRGPDPTDQCTPDRKPINRYEVSPLDVETRATKTLIDSDLVTRERRENDWGCAGATVDDLECRHLAIGQLVGQFGVDP